MVVRPLAIAVSLGLLSSLSITADPVHDDSRLRFRRLEDRELPRQLSRALDVRWAGPNAVYLAVSLTGTVRLPLDDGNDDFDLVTPDGTRPQGVWLTSHLGVSDAFIAAAAPIFSVGWKSAGSTNLELAGQTDFEGIEDIDVFAHRLVVLGLRRDPQGDLAPDGAIAWTGSLDLDLSDLRPVLFSAGGPPPRQMNSCLNFEIGAIRFLPDGSFLVVPGAEPGAFLYDREGKLLHAWETEPLGLDLLCDFDDAQRDLMSGNPLPRWAWVNRFRTVDEILPLPEGPGLVIRRVTADGTRWEVKILSRSGPVRSFDLPIESPSNLVHLHADLRDGRVVFLLYDNAVFLNDGPKKMAAERPRLIFGELTGESR